MSALCISCGGWKQAPISRCGCGFAPARGSLEQAKSYLLAGQFRSTAQLEQAARAMRAGGAGVLAAIALPAAFRLMSRVDRKVGRR